MTESQIQKSHPLKGLYRDLVPRYKQVQVFHDQKWTDVLDVGGFREGLKPLQVLDAQQHNKKYHYIYMHMSVFNKDQIMITAVV